MSSGEFQPPRGSFDPEGNFISEDTVLGQELGVLVETFGKEFHITPSLIEAYCEQAVQVHEVGLPITDQAIGSSSNAAKKESILDFGNYHSLLSTGSITDKWHGVAAMAAEMAKIDPSKAAEGLRGKTAQFIQQSRVGIRDDEVFMPINSAFGLAYGKEIDSKPTHITGLPEEDLLLIMSPQEIASGVTSALISERLRERRRIDVSNEALDARASNFFSVLQIQLGKLFLVNAAELGSLGRGREDRAISLFNRYKDKLGEDNFAHKEAMIRELSVGIANFAHADPNSFDAAFLQSLKHYLGVCLGQVQLYKQSFVKVYEASGYELPAFLRPPAPVKPLLVQSSPATVERASVIEPDPSRIQELQGQIAELTPRVTQFNGAWRYSRKGRTSEDLDRVVQALTKGTQNALGQPALTAMERTYAAELTDVLAKIAHYTSPTNTTPITERLEAASNTQRTLMEQLRALRQFAGEHHIQPSDAEFPPLLQLTSHLATYRADWPAWRQLIIDTWPKNVHHTVSSIESALFPSQTNPVSAEKAKEEMGFEEIKELLQRQRIRKLSQIVLPPKPSTEQIQDAFRQAGVRGKWTESAIWPRVLDLLEVNEALRGELFTPVDIAEIRPTARMVGGTALYLFAEITLDDENIIAYGESPAYGSASLLLNQRLLPQGKTWIDTMLATRRRDIESIGGKRVIHSPAKPHGKAHQDKIMGAIEALWLAEKE